MKTRFALSLLPTVALAFLCQGDVVELKNGTVLNGRYMGGTAGTVRFETADGIQVLPTGDVLALTFTSEGGSSESPPVTAATATAAQTAAEAPVAPAKPASVNVPAGTTLLVRINQPLSTDSVRTGDRFTAHLDAELVVNDVLVAPKGTPVYGTVLFAERAKRVRGQSELEIAITELTINGELQPIKTTSWDSKAEKAAAAALKGAAAGAAIGGLADGSDGAQTGAAIGATLGALRKGDAIHIPPNQLIEFKTSAPSEIKVSH